MKKRILSVLLAAAMVGTMLVGCGSSSSSKSSDDKKIPKVWNIMFQTFFLSEILEITNNIFLILLKN